MAISAAALAAMLAVTGNASALEAVVARPIGPSYTEHADADHLGVRVNTLRLKVLGGFDGERVQMKDLVMVWTLGRTHVYARRGDDRDMTRRHLYADRDGDGVVDTGALYNPKTGVVSADFDCNGTGEQVLADVRP
jgi:hypothetical protein